MQFHHVCMYPAYRKCLFIKHTAIRRQSFSSFLILVFFSRDWRIGVNYEDFIVSQTVEDYVAGGEIRFLSCFWDVEEL